jgi:two-component system cell cycle response regulator
MPKYLLVIDPIPTNRIQLSAVLEAAQYDVTTVGSAKDIKTLPQNDPDLLVLGLHQDQPAQALAAVKAAGLHPDTPVICLDADASPLRRLRALKAGAREFMARSIPSPLLLALVRGLLREGDAERECERRRMTATSFGFAEDRAPFATPERVACIMGRDAQKDLPGTLEAALPHRLEILSVQDALRDNGTGDEPDAYLIAPGTDEEALETLLPELRLRSHSRHAPVLVVHEDNPKHAIRALNLGASDIAQDTSSGDELAIRIDAILRRKRLRDMLRKTDEQSYRMAVTDPLTGLYNRRYAEAYLADLLMREAEQGRGYVLMLIDLDHFKAINDQHGHGAGDQVLRHVADRLRDNLRAGDLVARYGGEEFLIVLPDASTGEGEFTAERLRRAIGSAPVTLDSGETIAVTASIGVGYGAEEPFEEPILMTGTFDVPQPNCALSLDRLVGAADAALYRAKSAGRNRVEFSVS